MGFAPPRLASVPNAETHAWGIKELDIKHEIIKVPGKNIGVFYFFLSLWNEKIGSFGKMRSAESKRENISQFNCLKVKFLYFYITI